jgi:hypothetical protein
MESQFCAGVAGGDAVDQVLVVQKLMALMTFSIGALAAAAVGGGLVEALQRDGGDEVVDPEHLVGKLLVDEGGVGEAEEDRSPSASRTA